LRDAFKILLEDQNKEVIINLAENIDVTIKNYSNDHGVKACTGKPASGENSLTPSGS
jgi:hypothetical protein